MELPSHLPRDTGDDLCTRTMQLDIGPHMDRSGSPFHVIVQCDDRCNPPFRVRDLYDDIDYDHRKDVMTAVVRTLFDRVIDE